MFYVLCFKLCTWRHCYYALQLRRTLALYSFYSAVNRREHKESAERRKDFAALCVCFAVLAVLFKKLNRKQSVQECDATRLHQGTIAGNITNFCKLFL